MIEQKCRHPKTKWRGVPVILTTNKLPAVMRPPKRYEKEEEYAFRERHNNYMAFMTRCRSTQINQSHRNGERFPYTTDQLALYMNHLCNTMDPLIEEEYLSEPSEEEIIPAKRPYSREELEANGYKVAPDYDNSIPFHGDKKKSMEDLFSHIPKFNQGRGE